MERMNYLFNLSTNSYYLIYVYPIFFYLIDNINIDYLLFSFFFANKILQAYLSSDYNMRIKK